MLDECGDLMLTAEYPDLKLGYRYIPYHPTPETLDSPMFWDALVSERDELEQFKRQHNKLFERNMRRLN